MDETETIVRRLEGEADAALYREIRLESLKRDPEAFLAVHADEAARPFDDFVSRLRDSVVFGAFRGEEIVGIAGYSAERHPRLAHKGMLWGVYVRPKARGGGLARRLIEAALGHAAGEIETVNLVVERGNMSARRLYTALGFVEYGLEKDAVRIGDRYFDNVLMAKSLR